MTTKLWAFTLLALAGLPAVWAQEPSSLIDALEQMPPCARNCIIAAVPKSPCSLTNETCLCEDPTVNQGARLCITTACSIKEALSTQNLTATACHAPFRDKSSEYSRVTTAFGVLAQLFVVQRLAFKIWAKIGLGNDDWMTLATGLCALPATIINTRYITENGFGRDIWTVPSYQITNFIRLFFIQEVFYFAVITLLKLSLILFYIRTFPGRLVSRLLWGTLVFTVVYGVAFIIVAVLQCRPLSYYWNQWDGEHEGKCSNINAVVWSHAVISIALDVWMLAIPLWQLSKLQLDWKRKLGVSAMFCVGTFVTVVSILRLKSLISFGSDSPNPTWEFFGVGIWSTVEANVGIMCICMPAFRLLLIRIFPKLQGTTQRYYAERNNTVEASANTNIGTKSLGHVASSSVQSYNSTTPEPNGITYEREYTVEYGDNDEAQLVHMRNLGKV